MANSDHLETPTEQLSTPITIQPLYFQNNIQLNILLIKNNNSGVFINLNIFDSATFLQSFYPYFFSKFFIIMPGIIAITYTTKIIEINVINGVG